MSMRCKLVSAVAAMVVIVATVMSSAVWAQEPPPARISHHGQISLTEAADPWIVLPEASGGEAQSGHDDGRFGFSGEFHVVAVDPADDRALAMQLSVEDSYAYTFEVGSEPTSLILEWEQYHSQVGGSDCEFFSLTTIDEQALALMRQMDQTILQNVPRLGDIVWSENLPLDQWVRLRLEFVARSGGVGSNDGSLTLSMDSGAGLLTVATTDQHDFAAIRQVNLSMTIGTTVSRLAAWRRLAWDATSNRVFGAAGTTDPLWVDTGHQLGAMEPGDNSDVRVKTWVHYNHGLYGTGDVGYAAAFEIDTTDTFDAPVTQTATILAENAYKGVATFDGLLPNTRYYLRAHLVRDDVIVATTQTSTFRTISVPGGEPGQLHVVHGGCSSSRASHTPALVFRLALQEAPEEAAIIFSHVGDINYIDSQGQYENAPPGEDNPRAVDWVFDRLYSQSVLTQEFNELASNATCWFMWDDHEIVNEWSGPGLGGENAADPALFDLAQDAAYRWWGNRLLDETSLTRRYFHVETAECLFIYFDVRTYSDEATTLIGEEQKNWAKQLLETKVKPIVFFMSSVTWSSNLKNTMENWSAHTAERDDLIMHFLDNNPDGYLYLLSSDRHFGMHNTRDFRKFGERINGDFMLGVYAVTLQDPALYGFQPGGEFEADHVETFGVEVGGHVRAYLKVDINEIDLSVRVAMVNATTGEEPYVVSTQVPRLGDLDGDGLINSADLLLLLGAWGACVDCNDCPADLDGDCIVGTLDLLLMLGNWS